MKKVAAVMELAESKRREGLALKIQSVIFDAFRRFATIRSKEAVSTGSRRSSSKDECMKISFGGLKRPSLLLLFHGKLRRLTQGTISILFFFNTLLANC
ncbi:hypothetical protein V6N13_035340 [Hibiscus sabdariffa]